MDPFGGGILIWLHVSLTEHQKNGSIWRGYPDLAPYGTYESSCNWNQISVRAQMVPIISGKTVLNWNQIGGRVQMVPIISGKTVLDWNQIGGRAQMVPIISGKTVLNWNQISGRAQMVPIISGKTVLDWNQIGPRVQMVPISDEPHALCVSLGLFGTARNSIAICKPASLKIQGDVPYHWTHE